MARIIKNKAKISRREGIDLFLNSFKKPIENKCKLFNRPGQHGKIFKNRISNYNLQLREKQKVKCIYGVLEKQFKNYFLKAYKMKGNTANNLILLLESRLDNIIYRMGFGRTRSEARQMVSHKNLTVNNNIINIPSYQVKLGDIIAIRNKFKNQVRIKKSLKLLKKKGFPSWINIDLLKLTGIYKKIPNIKEINYNINLSLIIELYSK